MVTYSWHRGRLAALVAATGVAVALLAAGPAFADSINFTYSTPGTYTVTVPPFTTSMETGVAGAGGTNGASGSNGATGGAGGVGSIVGATAPVAPGTSLAPGDTLQDHWKKIRGRLPRGIRLTAGGKLHGKPRHRGVYRFTVRATDSTRPRMTATARLVLRVRKR